MTGRAVFPFSLREKSRANANVRRALGAVGVPGGGSAVIAATLLLGVLGLSGCSAHCSFLMFYCHDDLVAKAPDKLIPPDQPGPYGVSATTLDWTDARGQTLRAEVWYPVDLGSCEPEPYEELPISGLACRDEPPRQGNYELIAFSHGFTGIRYQSIFLTETLAQHGYVVVAPDHPGNTLLDFDETRIGSVAMRRPGDIAAAVDELQARRLDSDSPLSDMYFPDTYGVAGHSFGGWTSLAVAGGVVDLDGLRIFCADPVNMEIDYDLCSIIEEFPPETTSADFDEPDPRAISAIPMAPAGWYAFSPTDSAGEQISDGLSSVAPTLLFGGTLDETETIDKEIRPLWDRLPTPAALGILEGAGHYTFSDICLIGDIQPECEEAEGGYIELDVSHAIVNELALAWFGVTVRGDDSYQEYLDRAVDRWAELEWETR